MSGELVHATLVAVAVDPDGPLRGALLFGRSGSGKSTLALALIEACPWRRSALAADDAVRLAADGTRLVGAPLRQGVPFIEVRGFGPVRVRGAERADVLAGFDLDAAPARLPEPQARVLAGVNVPVWPFQRGAAEALRVRVILRAILANESAFAVACSSGLPKERT